MVTVKKATPKSASGHPVVPTDVRVEEKAADKKPKKAPPAPSVEPAPTDPPKRRSRASTARPATKSRMTPDQRQHHIQVAAYYLAERRGFAPGDPLADWLAAESEVDRLLLAD